MEKKKSMETLTISYLGKEIHLPSEWLSIESLLTFESFFYRRYAVYKIPYEFWYDRKMLTEKDILSKIFEKTDSTLLCVPKYIFNDVEHDEFLYFESRNIDFTKEIYQAQKFKNIKKVLFQDASKAKPNEEELKFFTKYVDFVETNSSSSQWFLIRTLFNLALQGSLHLEVREIEKNNHCLVYNHATIIVTCSESDSELSILKNFDIMLKMEKKTIVFGIIANSKSWILTCYTPSNQRTEASNFLVSEPINIPKKEDGKFQDDSLTLMIYTIQMLTNEKSFKLVLDFYKENFPLVYESIKKKILENK